jgi:hypothetical protein
MNLLTYNNPKTLKGENFGWMTGIISFLPGDLSGYEVCGARTEHCFEHCLSHSTYFMRFKANYAARLKRTKFFFENRQEFMNQLYKETEKFLKKAEKNNLKPCIRPNGGQDIWWETETNYIQDFPQIQFYDYTKWPVPKRLPGCPDNYYLLYSFNGVNKTACLHHLRGGINVAIPTNNKEEAAKVWLKRGFKSVDGDISDLRFLDPSPRVVLLSPKGTLRKKEGHKFLSGGVR